MLKDMKTQQSIIIATLFRFCDWCDVMQSEEGVQVEALQFIHNYPPAGRKIARFQVGATYFCYTYSNELLNLEPSWAELFVTPIG